MAAECCLSLGRLIASLVVVGSLCVPRTEQKLKGTEQKLKFVLMLAWHVCAVPTMVHYEYKKRK